MSADFTPTQTRILALLADGLPHSRREIHALLPDELGSLANIRRHICAVRKRLRPLGQDILCGLHHRRLCYRWVRLLEPARAWQSHLA